MNTSLQFRKKKGFTLIEMLVVVGIISILLAVGSVAYSTAQMKARDSKRRQDLDSMQKALEQVKALCNTYPLTGQIYTGIVCGSTVIMPTPVPKDPKTGQQYTYTSDGNTYTLCLLSPPFESDPNTPSYCLTNLQ